MIKLAQLLRNRDKRNFSDKFERDIVRTLTSAVVPVPDLDDLSLEVALSLLGSVTYQHHRLITLEKNIQSHANKLFLQVEEIVKYKQLLAKQKELCLDLVRALKHKQEEALCTPEKTLVS